MSQFNLLRQRRFAPFFVTQALAAFNDNAFRYALVGMATFTLALQHDKLNLYVNVALALFILPFFLFSASAGQLADKFEKARLIRYIKFIEIAAMVLAAWGFHTRNLTLLLVVLFLMGVHSTLFGPIKYAIVPQVLGHDELTGGNGLIETGTSLSILLGSLTGNALITIPDIGPTIASLLVVAVAVSGLLASLFIPAVPRPDATLKINPNPLSETRRVLGQLRHQRSVFDAVIAISWFWFFGATLTTQAPTYVRDWLGGDAGVLNMVLILFSIGVSIGSLSCERLSRGRINPHLTVIGAVGMAVAGVALYLAHAHAATITGTDWLTLLQTPDGAAAALCLTLIGVFAGLYVVPLYALVQQRSAPDRLARVIAANNILNALFMVLAALVGMAAPTAGIDVAQLIALVCAFNLAVLAWLGLRGGVLRT